MGWVLKDGEPIPLPNPGTGGANPRLLSALLTDYGPAHESDVTPGAVVGLPAPADAASLFIGLRVMGSPCMGRPCARSGPRGRGAPCCGTSTSGACGSRRRS
ncbi:hypothetical protein GCM10027612_14480 [Microbispora bryophytorum subsp. camponoti]